MTRIYKDFTFEAAHFLPSAPPGHPNARLHGHSFYVRVLVEGEPDPDTGLIMHFEDFLNALKQVREVLDHRNLNEDVPGLRAPTLELLSRWIWEQLKGQVPGLVEVQVSRPSCNEGAIYTEAGR